jgi:hypothetical protein
MLSIMALLAILAGPLPAADHPSKSHGPEAHGLRGGSKSVRELVEQFLRALREKDDNALRELRVTEHEYLEIIVPGSVQPGKPPRQLVADWKEFAWGSLDERSRHTERALVATLGGKSLTLQETAFDGGERQYAGYKAHRLLRLQLTEGDGEPLSLETGSVVEVGGRYKFIAFIRD